MAKPCDIPGLRADLPFRQAAAATVAVRAQELFAQADGVLDVDDIERVHDMRVATRRLRAVLEIYEPCFAQKRHRAVLKDVKALADALGARRDPDVLLAHLSAIEAAVARADGPGIEVFADEAREDQARGNEVLAAALERARGRDLEARLVNLAASAAPDSASVNGSSR